MQKTFFISDLHLDATRPEMTELFITLCKHEFAQGDALYILGDFVEYWLGDDQNTASLDVALQALKTLNDSGVKIYFMHGNRDFLIGKNFATQYGCQLLPDPFIIDLYGIRTALLHGDTLCTDDLAYQQFRSMVRNGHWQQSFLAQPLAVRQQLAEQVRETSKQATAEKASEIMDVNHDAVQACFKTTQAQRIIHGHTHRPGIHHYAENKQRVVLGDWYQQASWLEVNADAWVLKTYPEN